MRKTMNVWALIAVMAASLVGFFWYSGKLASNINDLNNTYGQNKVRLVDLENEQSTLKTTLENAGSDAFVEYQARTMYGYMMPNEIRFVITNPEALYGNDEVPSR